MTPTVLPRFDPHDEGLHDDPYSVYANYRRHDPVHWGQPFKAGHDGCWYLFRHDHAASILRDKRFRRRWVPNGPTAPVPVSDGHRGFAELSDRLLLSLDPPDHGRLRSLVTPAFTPSAVESYRVVATETADRLINSLSVSAGFDVIADYAAPLSMAVIGAVFGLVAAELEADLPVWISRFNGGFDLRKDPSAMKEANAAATAMLRYFEAAVASHSPSRPGLFSTLIAARDAGQLTHEELLAMCVQVVFAGYGTTVAQIGNMVADLWAHPDQLALLRADPKLMAGAVNESLRFNGSVQSAAARKPVEDVVLGGVRIRAGQPVIAFVGAANRDPEVYAEPDHFDITRNTRAALMFGGGIHHCLGARLARLECEIAVGALIRRLPRLALAERWSRHRKTNIVLPGLGHLRVVTSA